VLFADDSGDVDESRLSGRSVAYGFYWTEGIRGLGWAVDGIPTLKGGSTVGILTADGVDLTSSDDPTRRLIRQVLGAVAEFEKNVIVLKLRAARDRKRARGERVEGVKPFGHLPAERAVVKRMRELRRKPMKGRRMTVAAVAAQLNSEGHRNRAGRVGRPS
jgi:hypothetical protein